MNCASDIKIDFFFLKKKGRPTDFLGKLSMISFSNFHLEDISFLNGFLKILNSYTVK